MLGESEKYTKHSNYELIGYYLVTTFLFVCFFFELQNAYFLMLAPNWCHNCI